MEIEIFIEGTPTTQPRDSFRTILPSMEVLARRPRDTRALWHWLVKHCRSASRGVPKEHKVHNWKQLIKVELKLEMRRLGIDLIDFPVGVDIEFIMPLAKSKRRKVNTRKWHAQTPDKDNLEKAVLDALSGTAWKDDALVSTGETTKLICGDGDIPGVAIRIRRLVEPTSWAEKFYHVGETTDSLFGA